MLLRMIRSCHRSPAVCASASSTTTTAATAAAMQRQTAYVRLKPDADNLTISLVLAGRQRNLNRPVDEPLEKPFTRIRANLVPPKQDKRNKKKKQDPAAAAEQQQHAELFVGLFRDAEGTQPIDPSTPNGTAWLQAALLRVGTDCFDVLLNPPTVESLSLQAFPMAGYPLLPTVSVAFADSALSRWRWLRRRRQQPGVAGNGSNGSSGGKRDAAAAAAVAAAEWEDTGCSSMRYTPSDDDIGCMLRVECTPAAPASTATGAAAAAGTAPAAAEGTAAVVYGEAVTADTGPVTAGPEQPAARLRQLHPGVALPEPWRFRVMSYNILADQYAGTGYAQQVLFKYCPTRLLDNNYRRQLVLEEIERYQPDICCLQEVDDKVFGEFLAPHLALAGFGGHYTNKQGKVREGSAMFWRASKWGCAALQDVLLRDVFRPPLSARHSQFQQMLDNSPALTEALQKVTTIAQMVLLVPRDTTASDGSSEDGGASVAAGAAAPVLVINTHLFFHPFAPHIRSLHTAAILEEAAAALADWQQQAAAQQQQQQGNGAAAAAAVEAGLLGRLAQLPPPTLLFCGDLNSDLNDGVPGVIEMLQTGRLAADHWDWQMGTSFSWGKSEEEYEEEQQEPGQTQQQQPMEVQAGVDTQPAAGHPAPASSALVAAAAGMDVAVPFVLRSADDLATPYTNYTSGYKALLDYVWYDPTRLHVTRQLPVPAEQLLASFIPSPNFPSDHLAVVYDLAFKPPGASGAVAAAAQQAAGARQHDSATFTLLPATEDHVRDAVAALQRGEVIALPTDTLYGLAAAAGSAQAVQQMRQTKARAPDAPFAVAVADVGDVARYCCTEQLPAGLLRALLPGPVTVLLPLRPGADLAPGVLPDAPPQTGGSPQPVLLGVRVVASEFVRGVCRGLGGGIALTSANPSGGESSVRVADFRELWQYCGAVFDGGQVHISSNDGSTVLDLSEVTAAAAAGDDGEDAGTQQQPASGFRIVRHGVAADSVVELLTKAFGLQQLL